ncbi:hypothetical protein BALOs_2743 [Halobacteriovorax sp. BALOs_7]|uniref:hypothetical protein n=1 Tax=Halobacteriovorax sp. BALOs_7 TaxID=2109558 RepID=UPI000EB6BBF9|nr:hypothetical protein [Halobacteriovorax sp. BALOs_7]AYF45733.1 hypothetical protein BALOs_2743 [Halobacteriovorax sp. BALOs_7]
MKLCLCLIMFALMGCAVFTEQLWTRYPMKVQPDHSCLMGSGESGISYYLWECYEGKRTLIYNSGSGLYWNSNHRVVGECGSKTMFEIEHDLKIEKKEGCYEKFPLPYIATSKRLKNVSLVKENQLNGCDFIGLFSSYQTSRSDAIEDLEKQLSSIQAHAYTKPIFDEGIVNEDKWVTKGFVCYSWNKLLSRSNR